MEIQVNLALSVSTASVVNPVEKVKMEKTARKVIMAMMDATVPVVTPANLVNPVMMVKMEHPVQKDSVVVLGRTGMSVLTEIPEHSTKRNWNCSL